MATGPQLKYLLIRVKNTGAAIDGDDLKNLEAGGALDEPGNGTRFRMRDNCGEPVKEFLHRFETRAPHRSHGFSFFITLRELQSVIR